MKSPQLLVLFMAAAAWARAQDAARMDQLVRSYADAGSFMGSVLVAKGGTVILDQGYGMADLEWTVPNAPDTRFRLGSLTKQFTAASILLLEERGMLGTQDPVKKYLPDAPAGWDKVTIFNLLTHTSGIPSFTSLDDYASTQGFATSPEKLVARFRDKPLEFEPGSRWAYSNSGYALLGYLIEKVTGDTYQHFVAKNLFGPLGMKDSGYDVNAEILPRRAQGYVPGGAGPAHASYIDMSVPYAAGGLYSTTEDLLVWERGLFGGKVLSAASLKKLTTPFMSGYAMGLGVRVADGHRLIAHGGAVDGFSSYLGYYPDEAITVIVLGNLAGPEPEAIGGVLGQLAQGEAIKLTAERRTIALTMDSLRSLVGTYQVPGGPKYFVTLDGEQLTGRLGGQQSFPLFAEAPDHFFLKVVDAQIEFTRSPGGAVDSLILHQNGDSHSFKWVDAAVDAPPAHHEIPLPPEALKRFVGTYQLTPHAEIAVTLEGGQLDVQLTGQPRFPIFPEGPDTFFLKVVEAEIEFVPAAQGGASALILHQNGRDQTAPRE